MTDFTPDRSDFDAFGAKIAMNDYLLVQANNDKATPSFFVQFSPYNDTSGSSQCSLNYPNSSQDYVYCVAVGKTPDPNQLHFFFAGQTMHSNNGTFIGVAKYNSTSSSNFCNSLYSYSIRYLTNYTHQEHYVIGVEPKGLLAYGFANDFVFIFDTQNISSFQPWRSNLTWPNNTFLPHAVEITEKFGVVSGFIQNNSSNRVKYSPIVYLLNFDSSNHHPIVVDHFIPVASQGSWQDLLTNEDANIYSSKYSMSISINSRGYILVGMQFINRVFLLSVNISNPTTLLYLSRTTNGRSLGNGKSVTWLNNGEIAAILVNIYSLAYEWISSSIYFYDMQTSNFNSNSTPLSVFPNYHQLLPKSFNSIFLNIVASSTTLTLMNNFGNLLIFNPTSPGYFPSIPLKVSTPTITNAKPCLPGMYKEQYGVHDCLLCPIGTKASHNSTIICIQCASESLCPLGSVSEISYSALKNSIQVIDYPTSPDSTIFEQILMENTFSIGPNRCLLVSPLFWSLIVAVIAMIALIIIGILHFCVFHPNSVRVKKRIQSTFRRIDMIQEGELWVGGLASLSLIVLLCFAYVFSNAYLKQYPIETSSDSFFACDKTIRNAKFQTGLHSSAIPRAEHVEEMFRMLDEQDFTLHIDFINTLINCDVISLRNLFAMTWSSIRWSTCANVNSTLSLSITLPLDYTSVEITLADTGTIGAFGIGLSGQSNKKNLYHLRELNAFQSFEKNGSILGHALYVTLSVTKVINQTLSMQGESSNFTGIFIVTYETDVNSLFFSESQYVLLTTTKRALTVEITETPYYVKNVQQPIVKQAELIFHNILFTVVCFEIFGLIFILYRLLLEPIYKLVYRIFLRRCGRYQTNRQNLNKEQENTNQSFSNETIFDHPIRFNF